MHESSKNHSASGVSATITDGVSAQLPSSSEGTPAGLGGTKKRRPVLSSLYPERKFLQFSRNEGRFLFYSFVADLLTVDAVVLDFGAGRGAQIEHSGGHMRHLMEFSQRCKHVIGIDPDPIVLTNPYIDEAHVIDVDGRIPLGDSSVDLVVAYAVLEHVAEPKTVADEIARILKPGGWFCAWTPNKFGYVGLAARLMPNSLHAKIAKLAEPTDRRQAHDVFPVHYRMNTKGAIRRAFTKEAFDNFSFYCNGTPSYHFGKLWIARFWIFLMVVLPNAFAKSLFVFVQKKELRNV